MKLLDFISDNNLTQTNNLIGWNVRQAMRAVLLNNKGQVALMHIGRHNIYKLPGGGVDEGESLEQAFIREMLEETGCHAEIRQELGITIEQRDQWKMFQVSYSFLANATKVQDISLTEEELEEQFSIVWVDDIDKAIELVSDNQPTQYDQRYMSRRDLEILKEAKSAIK